MAKSTAITTETATTKNPILLMANGKQKAGKSYILRYCVERGAETRVRPLKLVDLDPHNDTLRQHYPSAQTPDSTGLDDRRLYMEKTITAQRAAASEGQPFDIILDPGGGDLLLPRLAKDVRFTETVERIGIDMVVLSMFSPALSDLEYFEGLEEKGFRPRRHALIFNTGLIQGDRKPDRAFDAMLEAPLIAKLVGRGAVPLFMPSLPSDCVEAIEKTKSPTFVGALPTLDIWQQIHLETWLHAMNEEIARPLIDIGWLV